MRDVTEFQRAECERLIAAAGHCSPKGSVHVAAGCGCRVPWEELRWYDKGGPPSPTAKAGGGW